MMRESPRLRRLRTDYEALRRLKTESSIFDFSVQEHDAALPAEHYVVRFYGKGLWRPPGKERVFVRESHEVEIRLGAAYPRNMPDLRWRTPIFHPNISSSGSVCLGGYGKHWVPGLRLDELCHMLWDMLRYDNYDVASPFNRDAATWVQSQAEFPFPLDARPIRNLVARSPQTAVVSPDVKSGVPVVDSIAIPPVLLASVHVGQPAESSRQAAGRHPPILTPRHVPPVRDDIVFIETSQSVRPEPTPAVADVLYIE